MEQTEMLEKTNLMEQTNQIDTQRTQRISNVFLMENGEQVNLPESVMFRLGNNNAACGSLIDAELAQNGMNDDIKQL